jgi:hypothetical protein
VDADPTVPVADAEVSAPVAGVGEVLDGETATAEALSR